MFNDVMSLCLILLMCLDVRAFMFGFYLCFCCPAFISKMFGWR